jgi:MFS family permease
VTLLVNRDFALLWTAGTISVFGDSIFTTTLVVWVGVFLAVHQSWGPLAVSGILLATLIPIVTFGPLAGVFVDRWQKRRTLLWMDALQAALIVFLLCATGNLPFLPGGGPSSGVQLGMIYSVVFLASLCTQLAGPARLALIRDIVPDQQRARASGLSEVARSLALLVAPPLAPILLLTVGAQAALLLNALSFVCSFFLQLGVRTPGVAGDRASDMSVRLWRELVAGLRFSVQDRVISTLLVTVGLITFGAGLLNALDLFFVLDNLHVSVNLYGFLEAAQGVGALLGAILAGMFAQRVGLIRTLTGSLLLTGVGIFFYSRLTSFVPALVVITCAGVFLAALNVAAGPLILRVTPRAYIGRVGATINPLGALMQVLGTVLAGSLASNTLLHLRVQALGMMFGPVDTIFAAGGLLILIGGMYALLRLGFTDPQPALSDDKVAESEQTGAMS